MNDLNSFNRAPASAPVESTLTPVGNPFKMRVVDENEKTLGFISFKKSGLYNQYGVISDEKDAVIFQINEDDSGKQLWEMKSGIAKGYFLGVTPNFWLCSARESLSQYFYYSKKDSTVRVDTVPRYPLSVQGESKVGDWIAVYDLKDYRALRIQLDENIS
ncbi:hypothetical protein Q8W40_24060 [Vibrio penaeicida]|uniref:hypothetical protein n=1 Tax=Vibrio penaeicida TaxID=104609 RepID=UPI00273519F6|nr:hypothetical protein [Vibrio penaeicida]MDP2575293.1 hypothetical protein [Vibrio penaeicida]